MPISRDQVLETVQKIVQVDLKFSGVAFVEDLQLVGGGLELDSLDLLMLVTGIEKKFGYKISTQKLNRESMSSVGVFVDFVHSELIGAGL
ncbi:MAG: acyl carrier protein [Planctomycetota bacterium]|nr:acyl carrier protein [Planctomycetota bacterium]MDA1262662.1 acyl carrier protein [Planctomycetota bacterium]